MKHDMRRLRRKLLASQPVPRVNLTPLIDTALTLLVIFMVTTPLIQQGIKVDLPQGDAREVDAASQQHDWNIIIDAQQRLFLQDKEIELDTLMQELKQAATAQQVSAVIMHVDYAVPSGYVTELMDKIKYIGTIPYVGLATQKTRSTAKRSA